jgi:hypothetical protein
MCEKLGYVEQVNSRGQLLLVLYCTTVRIFFEASWYCTVQYDSQKYYNTLLYLLTILTYIHRPWCLPSRDTKLYSTVQYSQYCMRDRPGVTVYQIGSFRYPAERSKKLMVGATFTSISAVTTAPLFVSEVVWSFVIYDY